MHVFIPGRHGGIIETADAFIATMRGIARNGNHFIHRRPSGLPGRINKPLYPAHADTHASRHEVEIMYAGHTRESLNMTSERMAIPDGRYTLGQLLCNLYKRGEQWVDELDDDNLVCTVNGREAKLFDTIEAGAEIRISS
jgi:molybdopterin converting factor small subunit